MAPDARYVLQVFAAMATATFSLRLFPFLVPRRYQENRHLRFVGDLLPASVMVLLVVYCLKDVRFAATPYGLPELLAVFVVAGVHLWRRNALLSIGLGTTLYIFLVRTRWMERLLVGG